MRRLRSCNRRRAKAQRAALVDAKRWTNKSPAAIFADLNRALAAVYGRSSK